MMSDEVKQQATVCCCFTPKILLAHISDFDIFLLSAVNLGKCPDSVSSLRGTTFGTGHLNIYKALLS